MLGSQANIVHHDLHCANHILNSLHRSGPGINRRATDQTKKKKKPDEEKVD